MINLRKLAEQQKNQQALKIKNRILKQTHDIKLAQSLSPITNKLDETSKKLGAVIKESTQNLGTVIKENNSPQLAVENTPTTLQPIENNEASTYDVELENALNNMKKNTGFLKTKHDPEHGWMLNNHPINILRGTEIEIKGNEYNITSDLQEVFTETTNIPLKKLNDKNRETHVNILKDLKFENYTALNGENKSPRYKTSKTMFRNNLKGQ